MYNSQQYIYARPVLGTNDDIDLSVDANVSFPVKKINFNFAYVINSTNNVYYTITSNMVNNDIVGIMSNFSHSDATPSNWAIDGFKEQNVFSYIFTEPRTINGSYIFSFNNQYTGLLISSRVVLRMEFLG